LAISSLGEKPIQDMLRVTFRAVDGSAQLPAATRNGVTTGLKASLLVPGALLKSTFDGPDGNEKR
jgi:hypothetical protein